MYIPPKSWENCPREDLKNIPFMIERGFTPVFSLQDRMHERTTIEHVPHNQVEFTKDYLHIRQIYHPEPAWRCWKKIDGHFVVIHTAPTLDDLLDNLSTVKSEL